jgi:hypothetical protein
MVSIFLKRSSKMDLITLTKLIPSPTCDILCEACDLHDKNVTVNSLQRQNEKVRIRFGHVDSWIHA